VRGQLTIKGSKYTGGCGFAREPNVELMTLPQTS